MNTSSESAIQQMSSPVQLCFSGANGKEETVALEQGQTVFAGSGPICGVQLEGDDIQTMHAMFQFSDGQVTVQDWNTGGGTLLNGRVVEDVETLSADDEVQLGAYTMRVTGAVCAESASGPEESIQNLQAELTELERVLNPPATESEIEQSEPAVQVGGEKISLREFGLQEFGLGDAEPADEDGEQDRVSNAGSSLEQQLEASSSAGHDFDSHASENTAAFNESFPACADPEFSRMQGEVWAVDDDSSEDSSYETESLTTGEETFGGPSFEAQDNEYEFDLPADADEEFDAELLAGTMPSTEDIQLFHEEIEHLQFELAQRDATIRELQETPLIADKSSSANSEDLRRLTDRVQQLVAELDSSDQRMLFMEEQLQMSEEANAAEQDERKHLESWVTEIEEVVSGKLAEFQAEQSQLEGRIAELTRERNSAISQLRKLAKNGANDQTRQTNEAETAVLKSELQQLKRELDEKDDQILAMHEAVQNQTEQAESVSPEQLSGLESQIRQLEVDASRDRAVIARQKAELAQAYTDLDHALKSGRKLGDDDCRIQAMRMHLREIHDEELKSRKEQRENSIAGRLSKLWNRVK